MASVSEKLSGDGRHLSVEVLPPLKGTGTAQLFATLDRLTALDPLFVNITTHHSEYVYTPVPGGATDGAATTLVRTRIRRRPGTVAVAAAIQRRYSISVVPHVICAGVTVEDIEYELLDLQFLGISNILLLRGDKAREDKRFTPTPGGHAHTTELIRQVQAFNNGRFADGSPIRCPGEPFSFGVAAYPEKHEEAPNMEMDIGYLLEKQRLGAEYAVTQLFYDNSKYYDFVARARAAGVTIPIVPGLKPFAKLQQMTVVPKTFHCDLPEELTRAITGCRNDDDARRVGVEWCTEQCRDLYAHGVTNIHFYTVSAVESIEAVAKAVL